MRDTSLLAYMDIIPKLGERQIFVYNLIKTNPNHTDKELTDIASVSDPNFVRPRRRELEKMNLIKAMGKRRCRITGKVAYIWRVCDL